MKWQRLGECYDTNCPEVARADTYVYLRSSERPAEVTTFTLGEWATLVDSIKNNKVDA